MLKWALDRAGLDSSQLGKSYPAEKIQTWLSGAELPTIRQAQELANKLAIPLGYLCLNNPPEEKELLPDFRTIGNAPVKKMSLGLRKTIEHAQACQDFLHDYYERNDCYTFKHAGTLKLNMSSQEGAQVLNQLLGKHRVLSPEHSRSELIDKVEKLGILVQKNTCVLNSTKTKLDIDEFRGFAIFDTYVPLIFINDNDSFAASTFTLIHELCHILLGSSGISGSPSSSDLDEERFCDKVAVEYLVPEDKFIESWKNAGDEDTSITVKRLAQKVFGVSSWVILRRALEFKFIDSTFYQNELKAIIQAVENYKKNKKGAPSYSLVQTSRNGDLLINCAVRAAYSGQLSFTDAHSLTGLPYKSLEEKARELRL
jgi:Zn-dependent peptidase ImmA (M78 family)